MQTATERTVRFFLDEPAATVPTKVNLIYTHNTTRLKYYTGIRVRPSHWDKSTRRVKLNVRGASTINRELTRIETALIQLVERYALSGEHIVPATLRSKLNERLKGQADKPADKPDLLSFAAQFIEGERDKKQPATITKYRTALKHLTAFASTTKKKRIDFDDVTLDFYDKFCNHLTVHCGMVKNTVGATVKNLKVFLNEATERGLNTRTDFKNRRFQTLSESNNAIYLTEAEIARLYSLDLSDNSRLEKVRDTFVAQCYLGLRYSDMTRIRAEHLHGDVITIRTQKTNEVVAIPLHPYVEQIVRKYHKPNALTIFPTISNQKANSYLKEIARLAGLLDRVEVSHTVGNKKVTTLYHKYELTSTHTARRSFATNLYLQGFPTISIMKITGHRTERAFMSYIRITHEQNAAKLKDFWDATARPLLQVSA